MDPFIQKMSRTFYAIAAELLEPDGTPRHNHNKLEEIAAYKPLSFWQVLHVQRKEAPSTIRGLRFAPNVRDTEALLCVVDGQFRIAAKVHFHPALGIDVEYVMTDITDYLDTVSDDDHRLFGRVRQEDKVHYAHDCLVQLLPDDHHLKVPVRSRQAAQQLS